MPTYEIPVLYKIMSRPELVSALKRTAEGIFTRRGFIRRLENLGTRETPYRMSRHNQVHKQASYFLFTCDLPPTCLESLEEEYHRDIDIIRVRFFRPAEHEPFECTLDEEMKPVPYRKHVQEMIEYANKKKVNKKIKSPFAYNSGLDYYPFSH